MRAPAHIPSLLGLLGAWVLVLLSGDSGVPMGPVHSQSGQAARPELRCGSLTSRNSRDKGTLPELSRMFPGSRAEARRCYLFFLPLPSCRDSPGHLHCRECSCIRQPGLQPVRVNWVREDVTLEPPCHPGPGRSPKSHGVMSLSYSLLFSPWGPRLDPSG